MSTILVSPPTRVPAVDPQRFFTREWRNYLLSLQNVASATSQILIQVPLTGQHASIVTTPLTLPAVSAGFYRINIYQTITTADPVSSSLVTTIGWTDLAAAKTFVTTGLTAASAYTTAANDGLSRPIHIDNSSPITYAVVYTSNTPNLMQFALGIIVEKL